MGRARQVHLSGQYDADLIRSLSFDWDALAALAGGELGENTRNAVRWFAGGYAMMLQIAANAPTQAELAAQLEQLDQSLRALSVFVDHDDRRLDAARNALANQAVAFPWKEFSLHIKDLQHRCKISLKEIDEGKRLFGNQSASIFSSFIFSMAAIFHEVGGKITAHKNTDRKVTPFVHWCWTVQASIPPQLRVYAQSEISFSTKVADCLRALKAEGSTWDDCAILSNQFPHQ